MNFYLGILLGILLAIYILPILETVNQVIVSKLNISVSRNNLKSTEFAVKTQELIGKENCSTNAIGFQYTPIEEDFEDFHEDE